MLYSLTEIDNNIEDLHSETIYKEFKELEREQYKDIGLTKEELRKVNIAIKRMSTGVWSSLPLRCLDELCPQAKECPLFQMGKAPRYRKCIIEVNIIESLYKRYVIEFEVKIGDYAKLSLIDDLVTTEILMKRTLNSLGDPLLRKNYYERRGLSEADIPIVEMQDGLVLTTNVTEIGDTTELSIHPSFELLDKLTNRKNKILSALVGTPQEKYKRDAALKLKSSNDLSKELPQLREKANKELKEVNIDQKEYME